MATLVLESLTCVKTTGDAGNSDEVYIDISTEGLSGKLPESGYWPLSDNQTQGINSTYEFTGTFTLTVMENDGVGDDEIGGFTFDTNEAPPGSPLVFTGEGSDYQLNFTYTE
jgi:hypothetical protein